jgi:ribosomal protein S8
MDISTRGAHNQLPRIHNILRRPRRHNYVATLCEYRPLRVLEKDIYIKAYTKLSIPLLIKCANENEKSAKVNFALRYKLNSVPVVARPL